MKLIDCTLRDGGYWNNWNWPVPLLVDIACDVSSENCIVETGYHTIGHNTRCLADFDFTEYEKPRKTCIMVDAKDYLPKKLAIPYPSNTNGIRIAIKEDEFEAASYLVSNAPYEYDTVFFNVMYFCW